MGCGGFLEQKPPDAKRAFDYSISYIRIGRTVVGTLGSGRGALVSRISGDTHLVEICVVDRGSLASRSSRKDISGGCRFPVKLLGGGERTS
jgi:hypothetical protein